MEPWLSVIRQGFHSSQEEWPRCSRRQLNLLLTSHTGGGSFCWHLDQSHVTALATFVYRRRLDPVLHDLCLLAFCRGLLHSLALEVSSHLPSVVVPRVAGLGAKFCSRECIGYYQGLPFLARGVAEVLQA